MLSRRRTSWLSNQAISKARSTKCRSWYLRMMARAASRVSATPVIRYTVRDSSGLSVTAVRMATMGSSTGPSVLESSAGPETVAPVTVRLSPISRAAGAAGVRPRPKKRARSVSYDASRAERRGRRQEVEHPGGLFAGRARPAPAEDGPVLGQDLGGHEQVVEGAMGQVGVQGRHDHFGVAGELYLPRIVGEVGELDAADLDVVFGRYATSRCACRSCGPAGGTRRAPG